VCKAGGLIITEALASGLPQLIIGAIPGQETGNAEYVIAKGAAAFTPEPRQLLETIYQWLAEDGRLLQQHAQNAARLGRPFATYNVTNIAWKAAQDGPYKKHVFKSPKHALAKFKNQF